MPEENRMMELQQELLALRISEWHEKVVSFQWFSLVIMLIVPWIVWWKLVDKKRITEILSFGLLVSLMSSFISGSGMSLFWWAYPYKLLPYSPRAYSMSYSVLPVIYMLMYQYFTTRRSFAAAAVVMAAVSAFIIQPVLIWFNMYKLIKSNCFYSFIILLFMGIGIWFLHQVLLRKERSAVKDPGAAGEIKKLPGLVSPALKRLFNRTSA